MFTTTPATLNDVLSNYSVVATAQSQLAALGIADPATTNALAALGTAQLVEGATALSAYATANALVNPVVVYGGASFEVNATVNPPILAVVPTVNPTSVPIPTASVKK